MLRVMLDCSLAWGRVHGKYPIYKNEMTMVKNFLLLM